MSGGAQNSAKNSAKKRRGNPDKIKPHQFKPGESGNPGGRPKTKPISAILERIFALDDGAFAEEHLRGVMQGKSAVAKVMLMEQAADRLEGKVTQPVEANINLNLSDRLAKALERTRKR